MYGAAGTQCTRVLPRQSWLGWGRRRDRLSPRHTPPCLASAPNRRSRAFWFSAFFILLCAPLRLSPAQTRARPGWAAAAGALQPWWQGAVFYRIDPRRFQATGNSSEGNLAGIGLRLDYLQALGVDALVLDAPLPPAASPTASPESDALENLLRAAGARHLRVLLALPPNSASMPRGALLQTVHDWLSLGAAGVMEPELALTTTRATTQQNVQENRRSLLDSLTRLLRATPGDRVLLTISPGASFLSTDQLTRSSAPGRRLGVLTAVALLPVRPATAAGLGAALEFAARSAVPAASRLLRFATAPATADPNAIASAAALLASPGAALFCFGDEIGLDTTPAPDTAPTSASAPVGRASQPPDGPVMQWTPANIQQAPIERLAAPILPAPGQPTPLGRYRPFVRPPPRSLTGGVPSGPQVSLDRNLPPAPPPPNTLPGFTSGTLPAEPVGGETVNVATEERDHGSVLNAYRDLLALRHGNPALRSGAQILLHPDAAHALAFLRLPPPGVRNGGVVVVAANLGDTPVVLSLNTSLAHTGLRPGPLRALFSYGKLALTGESSGALRLPPHAVFIGELLRSVR